MDFEIERKWILDRLPDFCGHNEHSDIEQCYFGSSPTVRIRKNVNSRNPFMINFKGPGVIKRVEIEEPITEKTYNNLREQFVNPKGIINKKYWKIPIGKLLYEISIVDEIWIYLEIEFDTEKEAVEFEVPSWFGNDVTDKITMKGYSEMKIKVGSPFDFPNLMENAS